MQTFLLCGLLPAAYAFQIFSSDSVAAYPAACGSALSRDISGCLDNVGALDPYAPYQQSDLDQICLQGCGDALSSWYQQVSATCTGVTYTSDGGNASVSDAIGIMSFNFNETCSQQDGKYCSVLFRQNNATTFSCDMCTLHRLQDTASSPFGGGLLASQAQKYASFTSSCGGTFTNYPLPTAAPSNTIAPSNVSTTTTATPTCTATYAVQAGDTCDSVASSQGTANNWLLIDNNLQAHCANFPSNGSICIGHPCSTYKVKSGDTCSSIASAYGITSTQLRVWNPWLDSTCYNINSTVGTNICVDQPGDKYVAPTGIVGVPTTAISAVAVPTDVATNTTTNCGQYYNIGAGDNCNLISVRFGISLQDLYILNPEIDTNCSNLEPGKSYCVQPVGSITEYPGSPFYGIGSGSNVSVPAFSGYNASDYIPIFGIRPPGPLAPGTATGCDLYKDGADLIYNYADNNDCNAASYYYTMSISDLQTSNPSLHTNDTNCTFTVGLSYCLTSGIYNTTGPPDPPFLNITTSTSASVAVPTSSISSSSLTSTTSASSASISTSSTFTSSAPVSTPTGKTPRNCNKFAVPTLPGLSCLFFAAQEGISQANLLLWNSKLLDNILSCLLNESVSYCVGVQVPAPLQPNSVPANCDVYAQATIGDTCDQFAAKHSMSTVQLYALNSVLGVSGEQCGSKFQISTYYCIGTY